MNLNKVVPQWMQKMKLKLMIETSIYKKYKINFETVGEKLDIKLEDLWRVKVWLWQEGLV